MNKDLIASLRLEAYQIMKASLQAVLPEKAITGILEEHRNTGKKYFIVSIGKAAWTMADTAKNILGESITGGIVLTKYHHVQGPISGIIMLEAGHPVPDSASVSGTRMILEEVNALDKDVEILFLLSGGGSALFELPVEGVTLAEIQSLTEQLLAVGADITEINTIRKRLSQVKAGGFALFCKERFIHAIILSDVIGNRVDAIASGPVSADTSSPEEALEIIRKYSLEITPDCFEAMKRSPAKLISNVDIKIAGSVNELHAAARAEAEKLGFHCVELSSEFTSEAKELGVQLALHAREAAEKKLYQDVKVAWIAGGETIVKLKGKGKGGRNQELALSAAIVIENLDGTVAMAFGSDGTDGPTDAAGAIVDGFTVKRMRDAGLDPDKILENNDSYNGLKVSGDLLITGPTGTNVNDLYLVLKEVI